MATTGKKKPRTKSKTELEGTKIEEEFWTCTTCKLKFKGENQKLLECEYCEKHFCIECVSINDKEYKLMTAKAEIHWYCPPCEKKVMKNIKNEKTCEERCEIFLKKVEERIAHLETELQNKVDEKRVNELIAAAKLEKNTSAQTDSKITSNEVKEVIQNQVKEQNLEAKEREKRLNNVIIFNLTESSSQLKTSKQQHDEQQILELCTEIDNNFTETDIMHMEIRRIGKLSEDTSNHPRPVLIKFPKTDNKRSILRNFHRLENNDKFGNIKIDHDKTKQEREESKTLFEEAKRQEAADQSGEYIYRVRGPPWERKIRKIRKTQ